MSELVVETLIQKVSNMLGEIAEINLLIRRLPPAQESINRLYERVDATHGILKVLENGVSLDETKLALLAVQAEELKETLHARDEETHHIRCLVEKFQYELGGLRRQLETLSEGGLKNYATAGVIRDDLHALKGIQYVTGFVLIIVLLLTLLRH